MDKRSERLAGVHPQMLKAGSEGDRQKLADLRPLIGQLVARALQLMGITKQDAAYRMGYDDPGTISRWCSGTERPLFDKLFQVPGFDVAYVLAMAERNQAMKVETTVTISRVA